MYILWVDLKIRPCTFEHLVLYTRLTRSVLHFKTRSRCAAWLRHFISTDIWRPSHVFSDRYHVHDTFISVVRWRWVLEQKLIECPWTLLNQEPRNTNLPQTCLLCTGFHWKSRFQAIRRLSPIAVQNIGNCVTWTWVASLPSWSTWLCSPLTHGDFCMPRRSILLGMERYSWQIRGAQEGFYPVWLEYFTTRSSLRNGHDFLVHDDSYEALQELVCFT